MISATFVAAFFRRAALLCAFIPLSLIYSSIDCSLDVELSSSAF